MSDTNLTLCNYCKWHNLTILSGETQCNKTRLHLDGFEKNKSCYEFGFWEPVPYKDQKIRNIYKIISVYLIAAWSINTVLSDTGFDADFKIHAKYISGNIEFNATAGNYLDEYTYQRLVLKSEDAITSFKTITGFLKELSKHNSTVFKELMDKYYLKLDKIPVKLINSVKKKCAAEAAKKQTNADDKKQTNVDEFSVMLKDNMNAYSGGNKFNPKICKWCRWYSDTKDCYNVRKEKQSIGNEYDCENTCFFEKPISLYSEYLVIDENYMPISDNKYRITRTIGREHVQMDEIVSYSKYVTNIIIVDTNRIIHEDYYPGIMKYLNNIYGENEMVPDSKMLAGTKQDCINNNIALNVSVPRTSLYKDVPIGTTVKDLLVLNQTGTLVLNSIKAAIQTSIPKEIVESQFSGAMIGIVAFAIAKKLTLPERVLKLFYNAMVVSVMDLSSKYPIFNDIVYTIIKTITSIRTEGE